MSDLKIPDDLLQRYKNAKNGCARWPGTEVVAMIERIAALQAEVERLRQLRSMAYGELPSLVAELIEPHIWDNMNVSEQRDWAVEMGQQMKAQRNSLIRQRDICQQQLRVMQEPVSDYEWCSFEAITWLGKMNLIIAARTAKVKEKN